MDRVGEPMLRAAPAAGAMKGRTLPHPGHRTGPAYQHIAGYSDQRLSPLLGPERPSSAQQQQRHRSLRTGEAIERRWPPYLSLCWYVEPLHEFPAEGRGTEKEQIRTMESRHPSWGGGASPCLARPPDSADGFKDVQGGSQHVKLTQCSTFRLLMAPRARRPRLHGFGSNKLRVSGYTGSLLIPSDWLRQPWRNAAV